MRFLALTTILLLLAGCSLYESPGRKFLEENSYTFARVAAQAACTKSVPSPTSDQWVQLSQSTEARVLAHENDSFELRVIPANQSGPQEYSCLYSFATAQELFEMTSDAVALTVVKYKAAE